MKIRDVVIGLVVLVALIAGALYLKAKKGQSNVVPAPTPNFSQVESKFPGLTVPVDADRISLSDVTGGNGIGEAWRTFQNGQFNLTVMANLPDPKVGYFYQGWIVKDSTYLSLGKLKVAKGGYISEFSANKDYSNYKKVVVTEEKVFNSTPETHILEGSF